jgi:DNA-directed RNA polymerase beta' subunit
MVTILGWMVENVIDALTLTARFVPALNVWFVKKTTMLLLLTVDDVQIIALTAHRQAVSNVTRDTIFMTMETAMLAQQTVKPATNHHNVPSVKLGTIYILMATPVWHVFRNVLTARQMDVLIAMTVTICVKIGKSVQHAMLSAQTVGTLSDVLIVKNAIHQKTKLVQHVVLTVLLVKMMRDMAHHALNVMKIITTPIMQDLIAQNVVLGARHVLMMKGAQSAMKSQPSIKELVYF